jgi:TolB protein
VTENGSGTNLYRIRRDGTELTSVTRSASGVWGAPAWSPDGRLLAAPRALDGFDIVVFPVDSVGFAKRVTRFHASAAQTVAFAPDGTSLIVSSAPFPPEQRREQEDLWEVNLDSGEVRRITDSPEDESFLDLSPDGLSIAVHGPAPDLPPAHWSGSSEIHIVDRATGRKSRLTHSPIKPALSLPSAAHDPAWSPDGCWLVYASNRDSGFLQQSLYLQRLDHRSPTMRLPGISEAAQPDWVH